MPSFLRIFRRKKRGPGAEPPSEGSGLRPEEETPEPDRAPRKQPADNSKKKGKEPPPPAPVAPPAPSPKPRPSNPGSKPSPKPTPPKSKPEEVKRAMDPPKPVTKEQPVEPAPVPSPATDELPMDAEAREETPEIVLAYDSVPVLDQMKLPRGGVSVDTKAVGRIQFGIPPETIKDSMRLGLPIPTVYIVPVERFCREMGPALGVNLAEFEFPGYFNFFVLKKRCTLIVDSDDAEENIRRVFSETLLGPMQFRREENPIAYEEEDFAPEFPRSAIPNFEKELRHFRTMPGGNELVIETLLEFCHFEVRSDGHDELGVPPPLEHVNGGNGKEVLETESGENVLGVEVEIEDHEQLAVPKDASAVEKMEKKTPWSYSKAKFMGDVATVWSFGATEEQKKNKSAPRVEVFKMPGGTEYIIHDIDVNNQIIGKARLSGHVKVSESMSVDGFGGHSFLDDLRPKAKKMDPSDEMDMALSLDATPSFHPPSFGVTVLGNSHGFDKSGSVSGYVLWINGRGVMIDPPPYSSATLEREGIRPRMIVGIILTHCHADHDAGAFQKVLTGSPVVVITTPTIYKSFIRKYAALSALSPALLRHSHRYKPAVIGEPLRFQGATFHFTYTLHSIPCVGFRVEWRGRSMVFTGDHLNNPPDIEKLLEKGVLSKARADDLTNLPLQETDVLLHESGAPPLHTPLKVLMNLPPKVKKRLYVVHTSALPEGCELKVAPTGTAGTIRLDQLPKSPPRGREGALSREMSASAFAGRDGDYMAHTHAHTHNEYETIEEDSEHDLGDHRLLNSSFANLNLKDQHKKARSSSVFQADNQAPPLVSLRPASSTDAWFILNLLSAVPFLSSLSYSSTMEVLETAKVDAYSTNTTIIPASRRSQLLCVVWEGTCGERKATKNSHPRQQKALLPIDEDDLTQKKAVWHAGDWTGPISLQPDVNLSGESELSKTNDVVAVSSEGVKVITVEFSSLHAILKAGSALYRRYLERKGEQERVRLNESQSDRLSSNTPTEQLLDDAIRNLNILDLLNCNSALFKLSAVQKRHLECLAEGPISFQPGERLWRAGTPVDKAFIIVSGTASFVPKRRNAGSAVVQAADKVKDKSGDPSLGDSMRADAQKAIEELGVKKDGQVAQTDESSMSSAESHDNKQIQYDALFNRSGGQDAALLSDAQDFAKLSQGLQKRAEYLAREGGSVGDLSQDESDIDSEVENESLLDYTFTDDSDAGPRTRRQSVLRRRSSRARFANKVLGRLYSRRAFTGGLVFSRGHFLGDVSKMVAGLLSNDAASEMNNDDFGHEYGFGEKEEASVDKVLETITELIINEQEGEQHIMHSSTLTAGKEGCVVLVFPKSALIPFMDQYPGLLLSLLGTQVVV